jgi:hypothetical protein
MIPFDTKSVKDNDKVLIFGKYSKTNLISIDITRRWTSASKSYYNDDKIWDVSGRYVSFGHQTSVKQQGHVHVTVTVCNNQKITLTLKDLYYNYIIVARNGLDPNPDLLYQKSYKTFWLIKQLFIEDVTNIIYFLYLQKQLSIIQHHIDKIM